LKGGARTYSLFRLAIAGGNTRARLSKTKRLWAGKPWREDMDSVEKTGGSKSAT